MQNNSDVDDFTRSATSNNVVGRSSRVKQIAKRRRLQSQSTSLAANNFSEKSKPIASTNTETCEDSLSDVIPLSSATKVSVDHQKTKAKKPRKTRTKAAPARGTNSNNPLNAVSLPQHMLDLLQVSQCKILY